MAIAADTTRYLQLDWSNENGNITVVPRDQDRFSLKVRRAIELLQRGEQEATFRSQLTILIKKLAEWVANRNDVKAAFLTICDAMFSFVAVREDVSYNDEFEEALGDLDVAIASDPDLDLIKVHSLAMPCVSESALQQFLHESTTLKLPLGKRD